MFPRLQKIEIKQIWIDDVEWIKKLKERYKTQRIEQIKDAGSYIENNEMFLKDVNEVRRVAIRISCSGKS